MLVGGQPGDSFMICYLDRYAAAYQEMVKIPLEWALPPGCPRRQ